MGVGDCMVVAVLLSFVSMRLGDILSALHVMSHWLIVFQYGKTALHQAADAGHDGVVRILVEHNADPDLVDKVRD